MKTMTLRAAILFPVVAALAWPDAARAQGKPADQLSLSVELGDVSLTKLPFIMAADYGIYERNGLKVHQYITPSAAEAIGRAGVVVPKENISKEEGDIAIGGGSPTLVRMTLDAKAPRRIILATTEEESRFHIISRPEITKPEDLKGKRIGYSVVGALGHFSLMLYLPKIGLDPKRDVSMFSDGNGPQSIVKGLVDALPVTDIGLTEAKKLGLNDLVDLYPYHLVMPGSSVNALAAWLPKNREAAKRFVKATVEAVAMMKNDKQAAFASMKKWYGLNDTEKLEAAYAPATLLPSKPYPSMEGLKNMQATYNWHEMMKYKLEDFADSSFITELDKSGYIDGLYNKTAAK